MNVYPPALTLSFPFFLEQWLEAVGVGWVLGMATFFLLVAVMHAHAHARASLERAGSAWDGLHARDREDRRWESDRCSVYWNSFWRKDRGLMGPTDGTVLSQWLSIVVG